MKVIELDFYMDGGTCRVDTDQGSFFVDRRLDTETEGELYDEHPDEGGKRIPNRKAEVISALEVFLKEDKEDESLVQAVLDDLKR